MALSSNFQKRGTHIDVPLPSSFEPSFCSRYSTSPPRPRDPTCSAASGPLSFSLMFLGRPDGSSYISIFCLTHHETGSSWSGEQERAPAFVRLARATGSSRTFHVSAPVTAFFAPSPTPSLPNAFPPFGLITCCSGSNFPSAQTRVEELVFFLPDPFGGGRVLSFPCPCPALWLPLSTYQCIPSPTGVNRIWYRGLQASSSTLSVLLSIVLLWR